MPVSCCLAASLAAQAALATVSSWNAQVGTPVTGSEAARIVLDENNLDDVRVEEIRGGMSAHFEPRDQTLRLGTAAHSQPTAVAVGTSLYEVGSVVLLREKPWLVYPRNLALLFCEYISGAGVLTALLGWWLQEGLLLWSGWLMFVAAVLIQVAFWPLEWAAVQRILRQPIAQELYEYGCWPAVQRQLHAATLTNLATAVASVFLIPWSLLRRLAR